MDTLASLERYAYELPPELVASAPASPRDSARLLAYRPQDGSIADSVFRDLDSALPKGALLVMNETKVVPARIALTKGTGGKAEILFYVNHWKPGDRELQGISDRKLKPGDRLFSGDREVASVVAQDEGLFTFGLSLPDAEFLALLEASGTMPIPKYIKGSTLTERELRDRYQTTFARNAGSVAAPTASLHFTPELFGRLRDRGGEAAFLTLHVGAGTFASLTDRELSSGKLHSERFSIPKATLEAIARAKREGRPVIPVGTTALRAVESVGVADSPDSDVVSSTDIFIRAPYRFKVADGLITNFHVPKSSLMCLVDAFLEFKGSPKGILDIYRHAIARGYRFYSFGDGMLVL